MSGSSNTNPLSNNYSSELSISLGQIPGASPFIKFGLNDVVGSTEEDLWSQGGSISLLSTGEKMNIASTGANAAEDDGDPVGDGARTLKVIGLDDTYTEIEETVTMNGTSNVLTANTYLRVYRMYVVTAGSQGANRGAITATAQTAGTVQAHIPIAANQTLQCIYTVPAGKSYRIRKIQIASTKTDNAEFSVYVRPFGEVFQVKDRGYVFENARTIPYEYGLVVGEKSDIRISGLSLGGASVSLSAAIHGVLTTD